MENPETDLFSYDPARNHAEQGETRVRRAVRAHIPDDRSACGAAEAKTCKYSTSAFTLRLAQGREGTNADGILARRGFLF